MHASAKKTNFFTAAEEDLPFRHHFKNVSHAEGMCVSCGREHEVTNMFRPIDSWTPPCSCRHLFQTRFFLRRFASAPSSNVQLLEPSDAEGCLGIRNGSTVNLQSIAFGNCAADNPAMRPKMKLMTMKQSSLACMNEANYASSTCITRLRHLIPTPM